jgi:hypothetical protein
MQGEESSILPAVAQRAISVPGGSAGKPRATDP